MEEFQILGVAEPQEYFGGIREHLSGTQGSPPLPTGIGL